MRRVLLEVLIVILFNCGHILYVIAMSIESNSRNLPVSKCSPMSADFNPTAKILEAISGPLLLCAPILFVLIPIGIAAHFVLRRKIIFFQRMDPITLGVGWLLGSLIFMWMFYTPYYQWLSD